MERVASYARHGVGDGDARQAFTAAERIVSNARHGVRDRDARQVFTAIECIFSDVGHGVSITGICNGGRNNDVITCIIRVIRATRVSYAGGLGIIVKHIIDSVNLGAICPRC